MGEILNQFGVEWPKLLAQVIIFLIVYFILRAKAFGPIQEMLEKRRQRIAEGEENLKKIAADLASAEAKANEIVGNANREADRMIREAKESASVAGEAEKQRAVGEANQIVAKARENAQLERSALLGDLKRDFGRLVVDTTSKVTGKVLNAEDQERINKETAAQVSL